MVSLPDRNTGHPCVEMYDEVVSGDRLSIANGFQREIPRQDDCMGRISRAIRDCMRARHRDVDNETNRIGRLQFRATTNTIQTPILDDFFNMFIKRPDINPDALQYVLLQQPRDFVLELVTWCEDIKEKDTVEYENRLRAFAVIIECHCDKAPGLYLSGLKLTSIPLCIGTLTWLKFLHLEDNCLDSLPDSMRRLRHLSELSLAGNQFKSVSEHIYSLSLLRVLNLRCNQLLEVSETICMLKQLVILELSGNQLRNLPDLRSLNRLTYLNLSANRFQILPNSIRLLKRLEVLNLRGNKLQTFPDDILGCLKHLSHLTLCKNQL